MNDQPETKEFLDKKLKEYESEIGRYDQEKGALQSEAE